MSLAERLAAGDQRALARAITMVENDDAKARDLLRSLYGRTGHAHVCGITGPPGTGKSTLVQCLAVALRHEAIRVAIVAVDPSSPFTGGALLGDRIRMENALEDASLFMRSLASRGHLGGLSVATADVIALIDAAGFDFILVETVGAGQSEIEIMQLAQTTLVVAVPGLGDDIQADKAGILEIADIFVVNKADRDGADRTANDLTMMMGLSHMGKPGLNRWGPSATRAAGATAGKATRPHLVNRFGSADAGQISWRPSVIKTVATENIGIAELVAHILQHRTFLTESGRWQSRLRLQAEERVRQLVCALASQHFFESPLASGALEQLLQSVTSREMDPYAAAETVLGIAPPRRSADSA
jgi:LAO/AO transport system kinase